ncbi:MAG: hypothetical protein NC235_13215 [Clostridiales bacterium]|nr:hypothetical protein [Clostridiales bacterium]
MSNEILEYYRSIWSDKCERAGVDEKTKGYFNYIIFEVEDAKNKSNRNKEIWHKVEILTIGFAACNTVFAALINF